MILALETSTRRASLAVFCESENRVLWESEFETDRSHNSIIFDPVGKALDRFGEELTTIVVGLGPGSYGGIRVGIAVANGLSLARAWKVRGNSSLEAYGDGEDCMVIGDARRKTFFRAEVAEQRLQGEPQLIAAEELEIALQAYSGPVFSAEVSVAERFPSVTLGFPSARRLAERAALDKESAREKIPLEPHYLRAPYITVPKSG